MARKFFFKFNIKKQADLDKTIRNAPQNTKIDFLFTPLAPCDCEFSVYQHFIEAGVQWQANLADVVKKDRKPPTTIALCERVWLEAAQSCGRSEFEAAYHRGREYFFSQLSVDKYRLKRKGKKGKKFNLDSFFHKIVLADHECDKH